MTFSAPPQLIVFDLDGTLVDSGRQVAVLMNELRQELGKCPLELDDYVPWLSLGGLQLIGHGLDVSADAAPALLAKFRENYRQRPTPQDSVFPGVRIALDQLQARGVELSICTNKPRALAEKVLRELALSHYFKSMCAGGDLPTQKPDPANLRRCLQAHDFDIGRVLMVGDSRVDQRVAQACEVPFGWYSAGNDDGVVKHEALFEFSDFSELVASLGIEANALAGA